MQIPDEHYMKMRGQALAWLYVSAVLEKWALRAGANGYLDRRQVLEMLLEGRQTQNRGSSQPPLFTENDEASIVDLRRR